MNFAFRKGLYRPVAFVGSSEDAATTAWASAVVTAGGSVGTTERGYVDTFIKGLKTDSLWTLMDRIWVHTLSGLSLQQGRVDLVANVSLTKTGTITEGSSGATGDATTGFFDTGFNPSTAGGNFAQNSHSILQYFSNNRTAAGGASDAKISIAAYDGTNYIQFLPMAGAGTPSVFDTGNLLFTGVTTTQGQLLYTRTGASATAFYRNSSASSVTGTGASAALPNVTFYICARHSSATADSFTDDAILVTAFGAGLNSTQAGNLQTRVNTLMTSLAVNTY